AQRRDARGGTISVVRGSHVGLEVAVTRPLDDAAMDGEPQPIRGDRIVTRSRPVEQSLDWTLTWRDQLGLEAREPLTVSIQAVEDQPPTLSANWANREQIVLEADALAFALRAADGLRVKLVGVERRGVDDPVRIPSPARGEAMLVAGGPDRGVLEASASFSPKREGIKPQTLQLRLFAVDYYPGRERVYSPAYTLHVLSADEHAVWLS